MDERQRELRREQQRRWREKNKDKIREHKKTDYEKNRDKRLAKNKEGYQRNRNAILERLRRNRRDNHEEMLAAEKALRAANPERFRQYRHKHRAQNRASHAWSSVKKQAKNKGLAFDLDQQWFRDRINAGVCEMSGLPFDFKVIAHLNGRGPNAPSVDRRDPRGPYTKNNCRMILWWINRAMVNLGEEYCLEVFRNIFIRRGEMMPHNDRVAA